MEKDATVSRITSRFMNKSGQRGTPNRQEKESVNVFPGYVNNPG